MLPGVWGADSSCVRRETSVSEAVASCEGKGVRHGSEAKDTTGGAITHKLPPPGAAVFTGERPHSTPLLKQQEIAYRATFPALGCL